MEKATDVDKKYPRHIADAFAADFPSDAYTTLLADVVGSNDYWRFVNVRDALSHRGALLRSYPVELGSGKVSATVPKNPKALAEDFDYSEALNEDTTRRQAEWTLTAANQLLRGLSGFMDRYS